MDARELQEEDVVWFSYIWGIYWESRIFKLAKSELQVQEYKLGMPCIKPHVFNGMFFSL